MKAAQLKERESSGEVASDPCPKCVETFLLKSDVISHILTYHVESNSNPNTGTVELNNSSQSRIHKCKECGKMLLTKERLNKNIVKDHSNHEDNSEDMENLSENDGAQNIQIAPEVLIASENQEVPENTEVDKNNESENERRLVK